MVAFLRCAHPTTSVTPQTPRTREAVERRPHGDVARGVSGAGLPLTSAEGDISRGGLHWMVVHADDLRA